MLKELAAAVQGQINKNREEVGREKRRITFVKAGEKKEENKRTQKETFLSSAKDWKMTVDLGEKLKIPESIVITDLRPDLIVVSKETKQMAIIELTVPTEDRIEIAGELKQAKYEVLISEGKKSGWRVRCWAVEVGCRGFPAVSMSRLLKDLGVAGRERRQVIEKLGRIAEEASRSLWKASHHKSWGGKMNTR